MASMAGDCENTEESQVKKFRLLIITDEPEEAKTFHTADRLREEADKKGYKNYLYHMHSHRSS